MTTPLCFYSLYIRIQNWNELLSEILGNCRLLKKELCLHFTSIEYDIEAPVFILRFFVTCNFQYYPLTDAKGVSDRLFDDPGYSRCTICSSMTFVLQGVHALLIFLSINGSSSFRFLPIGLL